MREGDDRGLPRWLAAALFWLLGAQAEWAVGDLEERERARCSQGKSGGLRLTRDVLSTTVWGLARGLRTSASGGWVQDLRYAGRTLGRSPGFTIVAVLTLGLGIGASLALFSAVDAVLLRHLPVEDPEELVLLAWSAPTAEMAASVDDRPVVDPESGIRSSRSFSTLAFDRIREAESRLTDVFAFARLEQLNVGVEGEAEIASGQLVSGGYHGGLGVRAALGRLIGPEDDGPTSAAVAVLSHHYWSRRFGSDPATIGRTIHLNGLPFTVVGVTPEAFTGTLGIGESPDIHVPLAFEPALRPGDSNLHEPWNWWLFVMGRLRSGAAADAAQAELQGVFQRTALEGWSGMPADLRSLPEFQGERAPPQLEVRPGSRGLAGNRATYAARIRALSGMALVLLVIACANVAGLLLARSEARRRQVAVRQALGASRPRLVRQLLVEGLALSALGAALGVLIASWGKNALAARLLLISAETGPKLTLDGRLLAFALALTLLTGMTIAALPALIGTSRERAPDLGSAGRSIRGSKGGLRRSITVAQVSLSFVLLTFAGLLVGTLRNLERVDLGFDPQGLLLFRVDPRLSGYEGAEIRQLYETLTERLEAVPAVASVTLSRHPLLAGSYERTGDGVFVHGPGGEVQQGIAHLHRVRWNFFATMGMPIIQGRALEPSDDRNAPSVAVVNESFARAYFGTTAAIGRRFSMGRPDGASFEIVGVVEDAKYTGQRDDVPQTLYIPYTQAGPTQMNFALRVAGDAAALAPSVRAAIREVDPRLPIFEVRTQVDLANQRLSPERRLAWLSSGSGLLALLLTCLALYGNLSYQVSQRTPEIGIRMALGARRTQVTASVLREALMLVAVGLVLGLVAAQASAWLVSDQLFGITAGAAGVRVSAAVALLAVAAFAASIPARRASKVDPMVALGER